MIEVLQACQSALGGTHSLRMLSTNYVVYYPFKVYLKQNKRLVIKVEKATGLAAANNDSTPDPLVKGYSLIW